MRSSIVVEKKTSMTREVLLVRFFFSGFVNFFPVQMGTRPFAKERGTPRKRIKSARRRPAMTNGKRDSRIG